MRLSSLKLSGFKSFADSTTLNFKANRTAVVGPNGCGKSNVIDAIRWVMGESSARQLRGGSMQDVIFTGTAKRKAVGLASVELRFDNTYGKLGGAYKAYQELAVRRQVTREGKSEYFLNGSKCRRRDITDIFLGTGLGPRSYAIIEQGMINRLVDAKPEEMRVFIEEAAGVSRYQARRRETMQHLEHTTQNLARLEDIASELRSQLKSLKKQAETAIQYQQLQQQIVSIKIDVLSFQCESSLHLQQEYTVQMNSLGETFKLVRSESHRLEHDLAATSALFQRLIQQSSPLQQQWQQAEKQLAEVKMTVEQKQAVIQQSTASILQLEQQKQQGQQRLELIESQIADLIQQQQHNIQSAQIEESQTLQQQQAHQALTLQHQQLLAQFTQAKNSVEQQQQQQQQILNQCQQLEKNLLRTEQQQQTLQQQMQQIQQQHQQNDVQQIQQEKQQLLAEIAQLQQDLVRATEQLKHVQQHYSQQQQHGRELKTQIQVLQAEQKNLTQLMVKHSPPSAVQAQLLPLLDVLKLADVAKPYADLIEKFLAKWLLAKVLASTDEFQPQSARQLKLKVSSVAQPTQGRYLADWICFPQHSLWQDVQIVDTLDQALHQQASLVGTQSILSLDGYHVGADWMIALMYDEASQAGQGSLKHKIRLDEIDQQLVQLQSELQQAEQQDCELEVALQAQHNVRQQHSQQLTQYEKSLQQLDVQWAKMQSTQQAFEIQKQQLQKQWQQLDEQRQEDAMQKDDLEIDLYALTAKLEKNFPAYQMLESQVQQLKQQLDLAVTQLQQQQQALELAKHQSSQSQQQLELLQKDASFLQLQNQQILDQMQHTQQLLIPIQAELPALEAQFKQQLQQTAQLQKTWQDWQVELNHVQEKQQDLTQQRHEQQQQDEALRTQLEEKRLAWQAAKSDAQHYSDQLAAMDAQMVVGLNLDLAAQQQQLEILQQRFAKLGAVNLAASAEYDDIAQRYEQLTHQMDDLNHTVSQLKSAMKSIDQETRKLFMRTFDQVNNELQILFPKVFHGGEASLSLEGDWQSGVKLMARPPGKRNSSLALLSGGEKALTALALVFAIFRLNPAPFCVLDEVDAPLDDANVGRFCNLVKELSEQVQFIYITHNKVAMTMATDLLGVTMPEPGTSKLVTVNLEEAAEYGLVAEA